MSGKKNNYEHFLMTRFNLATPGRELEIRTQKGWLEHRFDLFERFCLPTVASQSIQNFRWIVYFDKDTPEIFKKKVSELSKQFPFIPYYTGLFESSGWGDSISQVFSPRAEFIATTRLDSDDALGVEFIRQVQAAFRSEKMSVGSYNLKYGLIRHKDAIYAIRHPSNAFFTHLERNTERLKTAHSIQHMKISLAGEVFQLSGPPSWMQIIHDSNVSNKVRGWRLANVDLKNQFVGAAGQDIKPISLVSKNLENSSLGIIRYLRDEFLVRVKRILINY